jgi:hypothetical protein
VPLLDTVVPEYEVWERHPVALPLSSPFSALVRRRWSTAIAARA